VSKEDTVSKEDAESKEDAVSKVVLLAINAKYVHSALSVWVLAEGVARYARARHDVHVVEATIHQQDSEIAGKVSAIKPDVVGVSAYIWNAGKLPGLLILLRETIPGAVFVLGGPEASFNSGYWLEQGADYVLKGEGEYTFAALLDGLSRGSGIKPGGVSPDRMPQSDEPIDSAREYIMRERAFYATSDTEGPPPCGMPAPVDPYTDAYFDALGDKIAYIETSRGCPFECAFCLSAGSGVRFFLVGAAKEQLLKLSQTGARTIKFVDRTFNCDASRAYELLEYVIGMNTVSRFHFEVAADLFDSRTISLLRTAPPGRIQFEAGLQSFFPPALKAVSRRADIGKAERNIRELLREGNIHIHLDLIAGLPYETLADFMDSFDRAYALGAHTLQLGFLKLLHGSTLRERAEALGIRYSSEPPYEIRSSRWLSEGDIAILKRVENALQHTYNKRRFLSTLEYVQSASGVRLSYLFENLGALAWNAGTDLSVYAAQVLDVFAKLPGVDGDMLRDRMVCDWLGMVKGKNMPEPLRAPDNRRIQAAGAAESVGLVGAPGFTGAPAVRRGSVIKEAEKQLGRKIRRDEAAVLSSGVGVYVDSEDRDPVTGLYKVLFLRIDSDYK